MLWNREADLWIVQFLFLHSRGFANKLQPLHIRPIERKCRMICLESKKYEIVPMKTNKIIRYCPSCGNKSVYYSTNKIRVNANGKKIDVWLIYQCGKCKHTYNLPVYRRMNRNKIDRSEYKAFLENNQKIANRCCLDRNMLPKGDVIGSDEPAYILKDMGTSIKENAIQFFNPHNIRVRYDRLIAECLKISRSKAQKLLKAGELKENRLSNNEVIFSY